MSIGNVNFVSLKHNSSNLKIHAFWMGNMHFGNWRYIFYKLEISVMEVGNVSPISLEM